MLKIYNTISRKKEILRPRKANKVNIFVCGPTVYDFPHLGHARTYISFDAFVKYLRHKGFGVFYLQNITDIDDKIIARAKEKKTTPKKLAKLFEKEYMKDMKSLKVDSVTKYARATDHIKEIQSQVKRLLDKGYGYKIEDGIYYDISKFKDYGKLSGRTIIMAEDAVSRIDETKGKRNRGDFCLWKYAKSLSELPARSTRKGTYEYEPSWPSPWGYGRPGWHIEDTAITEKYFGPQYDIHGGAKDLIFPHHEAEIAQIEAISGKKPMVKYWFHTGFLTVKGEKMSKSLGNFITVRDFLKENSPRFLRFLVIKNHYRSPIDYNEKLISQTKKEIERIDEFVTKLKTQSSKRKAKTQNLKLIKTLVLKTQKEFEEMMDNDFNTPKALASLFELINRGNSLLDQNLIAQNDAKDILEFLRKIDGFLNFIFWKKPKEKIPENILKLVEKREKCRKQKNWKAADEVREAIKKLGWWVEDTKEGPKIKMVSVGHCLMSGIA